MTRSFALRLAAAILVPMMVAAAQPAVAATAAPAKVTLDHISVVKVGDGPPVVLIPGLATPLGVWDGVVPALVRDHTVYLVQVNGFGGDAPGANLKPGVLDGIVGDLHTYLTSEKAPPVRLVGHSMGGLAGLMFAKAHPKQVERLMVVDALPFFSVLFDPAASEASMEPIASKMRDKVAARYGQPADPAELKGDVVGLALKPESRAALMKWAAAADPRVTAQTLYEDLTTDFRPGLATLTTPVTLVYPWSDSGFGKERTTAFYRRQYSAVPNIAFVDIGDAGHFAMLDQPERFAEALYAFLK